MTWIRRWLRIVWHMWLKHVWSRQAPERDSDRKPPDDRYPIF